VKHRSARLEDVLCNELAELMRRELADPRLRLATISRAEVSHDLSHARIGISVLGSDQGQREAAVAALVKASGFLRARLASRLKLRIVPELAFELDHGAEHSQNISDLLDSLHHDPDPSS